MTGPRIDPPTPNLEAVLAQRANEAMQAGADPKAATDILGKMVAHLRANPEFAKQGAAALARGASPSDVAGVVWQHANAPTAPIPAPEGLASRVLSGVGNSIGQLVTHPIDTVKGMGRAALADLSTIGENMNAGMGQPNQNTPAIAAQLPGALARTATTAAFPSIAGGVTRAAGGGVLAKALGLATAGGAAGVAQEPNDPVAGGLKGAILAPLMGGAGKVAGDVAGGIASRGADLVGRPMESRPLIQAGPLKLGTIEGVTDRAARLNAPTIAKAPPLPVSDKPLAPVDQGIPTQRLARGLKTSSPAAESVLRDALQPRAEGAVDRVINHGLETTGLTSRENGLGVVDDLIAQRSKDAAAAYSPIFEKHTAPLTGTEFQTILETPAGKLAAKRGLTIAANRMEHVADVPKGGGVPPGYTPEQWQALTTEMKARGMSVPDVPSDETVTAPTLKQAHYIKLGFDDLLNGAPEAGSGGSGPNNAAAIRQLKNQWLAAMDAEAPEYGTARKTFADQSDLIRAAEVGRNLFKLHPQEAAKAFAEMPEAARQVARRTGFDALAERVENGPADVERGTSKPRDQARMKLLFPDDASFAAFREGLKHEATMHGTNQAVLTGSNTADKLADMANMAGVTLPDVFKAVRGNPLPLVAKGVKSIVGPRLRAGAENLAAERARLLTAGADGNASARAQAVQKMAPGSLMAAISGERGLPPDHDPTLPEVLDPRRGVNRQPPSPAAQAVRQQVDDMNRRESVRAHRKPPY